METLQIKSMLNKVPQITIFFWIIKVLCTTVGETAADYITSNLNFGLVGTSLFMTILLAIALFFQFRLKKYIAWVYWLAVVLLSVVGTLITDNLTDNLNVPLPLTTILFSLALGATLFSWYRSQKTLSIHSITTTKREVFYWLTILFTFALGTASGDLFAEYLHLGYLPTGILILVIISIISLALRAGLNSILGFWTIYILTRPLGASIGDYLSQSTALGGLGLGTTTTSFLFLTAIFVCVMYLVSTKKDQLNDETPTQHIEKYTKPSIVIAQTVGMVMVFVILGVVVYGVHQVQASKEPPLEITANKPLGDLSEFRNIVQDTLSLEQANNTSQAQTRITDLETAWDQNQSKLEPTSPKDWTKLDGDIDVVLRTVRATNPDSKASVDVLNTLLSDINSIDPQDGKIVQPVNTTPVKPIENTVTSLPQTSTSTLRPLGDLSQFKLIIKDTLNFEQTGDTTKAKTRITDLETAWDKNQTKLQPTSPKDWTKIDGDIDQALKTVRATNPDVKASINVLNILLGDINKIDPTSGK